MSGPEVRPFDSRSRLVKIDLDIETRYCIFFDRLCDLLDQVSEQVVRCLFKLNDRKFQVLGFFVKGRHDKDWLTYCYLLLVIDALRQVLHQIGFLVQNQLGPSLYFG